MLNTFSNILLQNVASSMFGPEAGWGLKVGVPLVSTLILGEIVPKYIGLQNNIQLSSLFAPSLHFFQKILEPIRKWVIAATAPISRIMFFFLKREKPMSAEELEHLFDHSQEHGLLQPEEVELMHGYLDFQNKQLREVMWPREDILYYDINQPLSNLVHLFVDQECTRVPVCENSLDYVIGIIDAFYFFKHQPRFSKSHDLLPFQA